jgi:septal ring factor EnvC (AmiA/AmiB activator)
MERRGNILSAAMALGREADSKRITLLAKSGAASNESMEQVSALYQQVSKDLNAKSNELTASMQSIKELEQSKAALDAKLSATVSKLKNDNGALTKRGTGGSTTCSCNLVRTVDDVVCISGGTTYHRTCKS